MVFETFGELLIVFSKKGKSTITPLFNSLEVLPFASDEAKLFAKNFCKNSYLDASHIPLLVFPSRANLKLHFCNSQDG